MSTTEQTRRIYVVGWAPTIGADGEPEAASGGFDWFETWDEVGLHLRGAGFLTAGHDYRVVGLDVPADLSGEDLTRWLDDDRDLWEPPSNAEVLQDDGGRLTRGELLLAGTLLRRLLDLEAKIAQVFGETKTAGKLLDERERESVEKVLLPRLERGMAPLDEEATLENLRTRLLKLAVEHLRDAGVEREIVDIAITLKDEHQLYRIEADVAAQLREHARVRLVVAAAVAQRRAIARKLRAELPAMLRVEAAEGALPALDEKQVAAVLGMAEYATMHTYVQRSAPSDAPHALTVPADHLAEVLAEPPLAPLPPSVGDPYVGKDGRRGVIEEIGEGGRIKVKYEGVLRPPAKKDGAS